MYRLTFLVVVVALFGCNNSYTPVCLFPPDGGDGGVSCPTNDGAFFMCPPNCWSLIDPQAGPRAGAYCDPLCGVHIPVSSDGGGRG